MLNKKACHRSIILQQKIWTEFRRFHLYLCVVCRLLTNKNESFVQPHKTCDVC